MASSERKNAPGRGNKTPADIEAVFAEEYLRTGIATIAAKKAGIPERTGREVAERLEENPDFAARRRALLTRGLDRVETMLIKSCETAAKRISKKPVVTEMGLADNGHHYLRALSDAHRSLVARRKMDHDVAPENKQTGPVEVIFRFDDEESDGAKSGSSPDPKASS